MTQNRLAVSPCPWRKCFAVVAKPPFSCTPRTNAVPALADAPGPLRTIAH